MQLVQNTTISKWDVLLVSGILVLMVLMRLFLCGALRGKMKGNRGLIPRLLRRYIKPKRELKFSENLWYVCWHISSFCWGMKVLHLEGLTPENPGWSRMLIRGRNAAWYWFATKAEQQLYDNPGWPSSPLPPYMRMYYLIELAFWLSCFTFLLVETMRKDTAVMIVHHVVTCILIIVSYLTNNWRIGIVVIVIHDFADIFLYAAKTLHYLYTPDRLVDCVFVVFVACFFVSRLVVFPIFSVWPAFNMDYYLGQLHASVQSLWEVPGGFVMSGFLCVLQILHIFWFCLILKMVIQSLKGSKLNQDGDIRSDDELNASPKEEEEDQTEWNENKKPEALQVKSNSVTDPPGAIKRHV